LPDRKQPDKYQYSFRANACVNFVLIESEEMVEEVSDYALSECLEANSPSAIIDGSSSL
jgi:hypothetical protein